MTEIDLFYKWCNDKHIWIPHSAREKIKVRFNPSPKITENQKRFTDKQAEIKNRKERLAQFQMH